MFVETEFDHELGALFAHRRPRGSGDPQIWAAHLSVVEGQTLGEVQYETDRARFLGDNVRALYRMNVTYATLFPDLDGLARSVSYELEAIWGRLVEDYERAHPGQPQPD